MMDRKQFEITPIPDQWSRMVVITGLPGNRSDFVLGWLTTVNRDQFIPPVQSWCIEPFWGKNQVSAHWAWSRVPWVSVNQHDNACINQLKEMIRSICGEQRSTGARWAMSKSHYTSPSLIKILPDELYQHFFILDLLVGDRESLALVAWESFVKNIIWRIESRDIDQYRHAIELMKNLADVQSDRIDVMTMFELSYAELCRRARDQDQDFVFNPQMNTSCRNAQVKSIEYRDLMTSKGPQLLEDALGIKLNHDIWDQSLALTASRSRYYVFGRWWERPA